MKIFRFKKTIFTMLFLLGSLAVGGSFLRAAEVDGGFVIVDRNPWKVSYVQESNQWVLLANFDQAELKTYFNKPPSSKGLAINAENKPIKQEFKYYPSGKTFISKKSQFEQWPDGARAWAFSYDDKIKVDGDQFSRYCTTAIIKEVGGKADEIRYAFVRGA